MIPIDSAHARELRELEESHDEQAAAEHRLHDQECRGGWRGEDADGRPRPCLTCRPHLALLRCRICSAPPSVCDEQRSKGLGACCPTCDHSHAERTGQAPTPAPAAAPIVLPARFAGRDVRVDRPDRLVIVTDPATGSVPVRWRLFASSSVWRCSACGTQEKADCAHTFSAGLFLAEQLLGLTTIDHPERTTP